MKRKGYFISCILLKCIKIHNNRKPFQCFYEYETRGHFSATPCSYIKSQQAYYSPLETIIIVSRNTLQCFELQLKTDYFSTFTYETHFSVTPCFAYFWEPITVFFHRNSKLCRFLHKIYSKHSFGSHYNAS